MIKKIDYINIAAQLEKLENSENSEYIQSIMPDIKRQIHKARMSRFKLIQGGKRK